MSLTDASPETVISSATERLVPVQRELKTDMPLPTMRSSHVEIVPQTRMWPWDEIADPNRAIARIDTALPRTRLL